MNRACRLLVPALALLALQAAAAPRDTQPLDGPWRFHKGDAAAYSAAAFDDGAWETVAVPHTFNAADGLDAHPYRGPGWYRRTVHVATAEGRRTYIEFDGAALTAGVWVNGMPAGRHEGGFARFRFDVTDLLRPGANTIAVRTDNAVQRHVAPLGGDYTLFGGLYRGVRLVRTDALHVDLRDHGSSGVRFDVLDANARSATLRWTVRVANDRSATAAASVAATLRDAAGNVVASARQRIAVPAGATVPVRLDARLAGPHRWHGVRDPYLYRTEIEVADAATPGQGDAVSFPVGIRTVQLDPRRGLLLNGEPYRVHGVNVHQTTLPGKGTAVGAADIAADFAILADLGATGLRFAHYQHDASAYGLADRMGFLVWTEAPLTSEVDPSPAFLGNAVMQLRELIRQNRNHPSVFVWGIGNEIYKVDDASARVLDALQAAARDEDPARPTAYANCCVPIDSPQPGHADTVGSNVYLGWYSGQFDDLGPFLDRNRALRPATPMAVSEYGAGAAVAHQQEPPARPVPGGPWHPEQYQARYHEAAWRQLADRPWLWGTFVWVGFDFPSAGRHEGERPGINDKGLVTYDRKVRKDAFYWYQAQWSARPMVHIASARARIRATGKTEVRIYTNQPAVALRVNARDAGVHAAAGGIVEARIPLQAGRNRIEAAAGGVADNVTWVGVPASP